MLPGVVLVAGLETGTFHFPVFHEMDCHTHVWLQGPVFGSHGGPCKVRNIQRPSGKALSYICKDLFPLQSNFN